MKKNTAMVTTDDPMIKIISYDLNLNEDFLLIFEDNFQNNFESNNPLLARSASLWYSDDLVSRTTKLLSWITFLSEFANKEWSIQRWKIISYRNNLKFYSNAYLLSISVKYLDRNTIAFTVSIYKKQHRVIKMAGYIHNNRKL